MGKKKKKKGAPATQAAAAPVAPEPPVKLVAPAPAEADAAPAALAPTQQQTDQIFELFDRDGDGTVDMEELVAMVAAAKHKDGSELDRATIQRVWDADGDGEVLPRVCCTGLLMVMVRCSVFSDCLHVVLSSLAPALLCTLSGYLWSILESIDCCCGASR